MILRIVVFPFDKTVISRYGRLMTDLKMLVNSTSGSVKPMYAMQTVSIETAQDFEYLLNERNCINSHKNSRNAKSPHTRPKNQTFFIYLCPFYICSHFNFNFSLTIFFLPFFTCSPLYIFLPQSIRPTPPPQKNILYGTVHPRGTFILRAKKNYISAYLKTLI